ncbi:MAG: 4-alpha-glucanotransferase [Agathobacter sp.]
MRSSGILMHISSLPSPYGIGTLGDEARKFVDFLADAGQQYWQMLPICPTGYGDSPYQSFSTFAGNPYFIDLNYLCYDGLLAEEELQDGQWGTDETRVDYGCVYEYRKQVLGKAYKRFIHRIPAEYHSFCEKNAYWLEDYALYMAIKDDNHGACWRDWPDGVKYRRPAALEEAKKKLSYEIGYYKAVQFWFFCHWNALKEYAHKKDIQLIGDLPIYVSGDGADIWANPEQFFLDENLEPIEVAGCPPDAFTEDGQLWGNPLFRWDVMKKDNYSWWTARIKHMSELFDVVRIDHFRGFAGYYAIPAEDDTARNGTWKKGPGMDLFRAMEQKLGKLNIIVEDLGTLTPDVLQLVEDSGFPGMKVLQFAFDSKNDSDYLPHNHIRHSVVYTGSHDNDTILGWVEHAPESTVAYATEYLGLNEEEGYHWGMMRAAWASVSEMAIVTMQDLLGLDSSARMNTPSTTGENWKWRMAPGAIDKKLSEKIYGYMVNYARLKK